MTPSFLKGRAELGVCLLLAAVGVIVALNAARIPAVFTPADPVGPRAVPYMVSGLLIVCAIALAVDVLRGGHGAGEEGEDVDLSQPIDVKTVSLLLAAFVANIVLIDRAGWVVSGTILFWGSVYALGSRHYIRDPLIAVIISVVSFYGFYVGLGIKLPPGILEGVL